MMIKESLLLSLLALITMSGVSPSLINAQPGGIQPSSFGTSQQQPQAAQQIIFDREGPDMVLLSSRFNEQSFGDEIVGEIMNNGTDSADTRIVLKEDMFTYFIALMKTSIQ